MLLIVPVVGAFRISGTGNAAVRRCWYSAELMFILGVNPANCGLFIPTIKSDAETVSPDWIA
jgi:hypothetical protein